MKFFKWRGTGNYDGWAFSALAESIEQARQLILAEITNPNIRLYAENVLQREPAEYGEPVAFIEDKGIQVI